MVMKVGNINPFVFRGIAPVTKPDGISAQQPSVRGIEQASPSLALSTNRISNTIPDYYIKTPQRYTKLGVSEFAGGHKLHSYKLANGYRISIIPMEGSPATVKNYVSVGALNETDDIKGISHFLEHMAFNGTTGENGYIKLNTGDSFKKIDKLGGWTNASTGYAITDYINSTPLLEEKDLEEQIKIIAGMTEDLALTPEMIEKEKGPVCSEINMIMDSPETIANDQTVRTLFGIKSSADELIGGSTKHINNLTREKVKEYYDKYYTPDNMNLVITGDVDPDKVIELVAKNFRSNKQPKGKRFEEKLTPINKTIRKDFITDKATSTLTTIGFAGPKNNDAKSRVIYDVVSSYLSQTEVGITKEMRKINAGAYLGRDKVSNNPSAPSLLYYGIESSEENSEKALKIIHDKLSNVKKPTEEKLAKIKQGLLQSYKNGCERSNTINNVVGKSILNGNLDYALNYESLLNDVTAEDVKNYIDEYIDLNKAAITVVHPETTIEKIRKNHSEASQISFKGKRIPLNKENITETTLNNNMKVAFVETNNDNLSFDIEYTFPPRYNANPAIKEVLYEILTMGTKNQSEDEFNQYMEENNIDVFSGVFSRKFYVSGSSSYENYEKTFAKAKELMYSPRINQETLDKAKERIKDSLDRMEDTASSIYNDNEAKTNPLCTSKAQLLEGLSKVTVDDVKELHKYILENSCATITMNSPKNKDIKTKALSDFETLNKVKPYEVSTPNVYKPNKKTQVLTKDRNVAQAEILETFKFESDKSPRERALIEIMNTMMRSSSIGLFTVLREKEHLAYRVGSAYNYVGNSGEFSCHILTTTDNKENGEISYDNVQKSINGFNRQIKALLDSKYTDEDLENAKKALKADLLIKETTASKLESVGAGLSTKEGVDYENQVYNEIDKITREDIQEFANKVFKNAPIYSIVASKDTLDANKDFFETL